MDSVESVPPIVFSELTTGYDELHILHNINLKIAGGEALCIIGRNGMGKTTLLSSIAGRTRLQSGGISVDGVSLWGLSRVRLCCMGIVLVPQEREVFPTLTVEENLRVADRQGRWTKDQIYDLFPRLAERRNNFGVQLSGGEQQMLSIGRALMTSPRILMLDEPSEGLAPTIVDQLFAALNMIREEEHMTILLVEQQIRRGLQFCPRAVGLKNGRLVYDGPSENLLESEAALDNIMGLHSEGTL